VLQARDAAQVCEREGADTDPSRGGPTEASFFLEGSIKVNLVDLVFFRDGWALQGPFLHFEPSLDALSLQKFNNDSLSCRHETRHRHASSWRGRTPTKARAKHGGRRASGKSRCPHKKSPPPLGTP
jgi:hypothetical protein